MDRPAAAGYRLSRQQFPYFEAFLVMQDELDKMAGAALRDIRTKLRRSQEDVSIEIDMDQSTLSKVERLGPAAVGWKRFAEIARALGHEAEIVLRPLQRKP
jgi:hypothetical protein